MAPSLMGLYVVIDGYCWMATPCCYVLGYAGMYAEGGGEKAHLCIFPGKFTTPPPPWILAFHLESELKINILNKTTNIF